MNKATPDPKTDDDQAAFAAFTQTLSQSPLPAVGRPTAKRGSLKGWPALIVSAVVIGGFATAGALAARGYGVGDALKIAAAALLGGPFGACAVMAVAMLAAMRVSNRSVYSMAESGTYNDMPGFVIPVVWAAGYAGAVAGSALFAGVAVHLATRSPDTQFLFRPPAIGGVIGAILCGLVVGGIALFKASQAPREQDRIRER